MILKKKIRVEMPDGSKWDVPVEIIARNRASNYVHEFGGNMYRSLEEDTIPLFEDDEFEIIDWAVSNMNWEDVKDRAVMVNDQFPTTKVVGLSRDKP